MNPQPIRKSHGRPKLYQQPYPISVKMETAIVQAMDTAIADHVENVQNRTHLIEVAVRHFLTAHQVPIPAKKGKKKGGG